MWYLHTTCHLSRFFLFNLCFWLLLYVKSLLYMPFLAITLDLLSWCLTCLQLLWASNNWWLRLYFQVLQFVSRRLEQFLVCVIFTLGSSLLKRTYSVTYVSFLYYFLFYFLKYVFHFFNLQECFLYCLSFRYLFPSKKNVFNRKQGVVLLMHSFFFIFLYLAYSKSELWDPSLPSLLSYDSVGCEAQL